MMSVSEQNTTAISDMVYLTGSALSGFILSIKVISVATSPPPPQLHWNRGFFWCEVGFDQIHKFLRRNQRVFLSSSVCQFTLKLDERWASSCYTSHDGGFVETAGCHNRLMLNKALTLDVLKQHKSEKVGIKFIDVTFIVIQDAQRKQSSFSYYYCADTQAANRVASNRNCIYFRNRSGIIQVHHV